MPAPTEAYDYESYAARLADTELLESSLALRLLRIPFLAVPVGGSRLGGAYRVPCICFALKVSDFLRGRDGYPRPRLRWLPSPHSCHVVEWGEKSPALWGNDDPVTLGQFYGWTDAAIADSITKYAARRGPRTPSSAETKDRSPAAP
ncbi:DUF6302 family protein [Streptomyces sp. NPDC090053]|uniref:DUF6302 family protein n=1 Tax=Streptomyces sp. NPDC090053 TaxID=3365932 RepID=UPI003824B014